MTCPQADNHVYETLIVHHSTLYDIETIKKNPSDFASMVLPDNGTEFYKNHTIQYYTVVRDDAIYVAAYQVCPDCTWADEGINTEDLPKV